MPRKKLSRSERARRNKNRIKIHSSKYGKKYILEDGSAIAYQVMLTGGGWLILKNDEVIDKTNTKDQADRRIKKYLEEDG